MVFEDEVGRPVAELSEFLGHQTNNYAEYSGLLAALNYTLRHGFKALKVVSDSELLVKQINGQYKVSNPTLKELHGRAMKLIDQLEYCEVRHVLREKNREADRLANLAMDRGIAKKAPAMNATEVGGMPRLSPKSMAWCATALSSSWAIRCLMARWSRFAPPSNLESNSVSGGCSPAGLRHRLAKSSSDLRRLKNAHCLRGILHRPGQRLRHLFNRDQSQPMGAGPRRRNQSRQRVEGNQGKWPPASRPQHIPGAHKRGRHPALADEPFAFSAHRLVLLHDGRRPGDTEIDEVPHARFNRRVHGFLA